MGRFDRIDPLIIIGVLISITVTLLLSVLDVEGMTVVSGTIISLVGIAITLAIDIIARLIRLEENTLLTVGLSRKLAADRWATCRITDIIEAWDKIETSEYHPLLLEIAKLHTEDMRKHLALISSGEIFVNEPDHRFMSLIAEEARDNIQAISRVSVEFYRSRAGRRYLEENIAAAKRGVKVTRVFLYEEIDAEIAELIHEMQAGDISVLTAKPSELSDGFNDAFAISDDRLVWTPVFNNDMLFEEHHISTKPEDVMRAKNRFERVLYEATDVVDESPA
jgi:hypothetical protein